VGLLYEWFKWLLKVLEDSSTGGFLLDYGDIIIIAVVVTVAIYGAYRRITRKRRSMMVAREEKAKQSLQKIAEPLAIPEGLKTYDLLVSPKHFNEVKNLLVSKEVQPAVHIDKEGIHFVFETEKKWHCDVMVEAGLLLDFELTVKEGSVFTDLSVEGEGLSSTFPPLPEFPVVSSEKPLTENTPSTEKKKKKKKKTDGKVVSIRFTEVFPPDWTDDDVKKQIAYRFKDLLASLKDATVEVQEK